MNLGDATIIRADARSLPLPDDSVDLCVTSPPYFALRSYTDGGVHYDKQIGAEPTPAEFVDALLEVTAECMRVLKPSGSLWVNLGDKYAGGGNGPQGSAGALAVSDYGARTRQPTSAEKLAAAGGVRPKSLIGIPWRYALRCIDDLGLILRAEVIWSKPNGLPESVTDRVRRSHEQWFHFVLNPRYFSAVDEIREPHGHADHMARYSERAKGYAHKVNEDRGDKGATIFPGNPLGKLPSSVWEIGGGESVVRCVLSAISTGNLTIDEGERILGASCTGRPAPTGFDLLRSYDHEAPDPIISGGVDTDGIIGAPGSVWTVPTEPLRVPDHLGVDHFAAFPTEWPKRIIQGWSPAGVCVECGEGRRPVSVVERDGDCTVRRASDRGFGVAQGDNRNAGLFAITGYSCACPEPTADTTPAVVLDPFGGTGTTAMVAKALGRHGISVDMSADYCRLAEWRTNDRDQLAKVLGVAKAEQQPDTQPGLWETA